MFKQGSKNSEGEWCGVVVEVEVGGYIYIGHDSKGKANGQGITIQPCGDMYVGTWADN